MRVEGKKSDAQDGRRLWEKGKKIEEYKMLRQNVGGDIKMPTFMSRSMDWRRPRCAEEC